MRNAYIKKCLILFLFFICGASLFAQNLRKTKIFVPPVTGTDRQEDASFFHRQIAYEVVLRYYTLTNTRHGSGFTLKGSIEKNEILRAPDTIENDNNDLQNHGEYIFSLELINNATGETIGEQSLVYSSTEDAFVGGLVSDLVYNLLSNIPNIEENYGWRDKWLFIGLNGIWSPRIYTGERQSVYWANFGAGLQAEFHFLNFMSASLEVQFVNDWVVVSETTKEEYSDLMLEIPLSLKYVIKPFDYFMLELYAGVSFNFSLTGFTQPSLCSWFAGFQFGVKAGPGVITFDPRFSMDFFNSLISSSGVEYTRNLIQIAAGYKLGFFPKSQWAKN